MQYGTTPTWCRAKSFKWPIIAALSKFFFSDPRDRFDHVSANQLKWMSEVTHLLIFFICFKEVSSFYNQLNFLFG